MTVRIPYADPAAPGGDEFDEPLPPARFAYDRHTWKEIAHLLANLPVAVFGFVYVATVLFVSAGLTVTVVGFPLLALGLMGARLIGKFERRRARRLLGLRIDEPSPLPLRKGAGCCNGCGWR